jgi:hypothetical protein
MPASRGLVAVACVTILVLTSCGADRDRSDGKIKMLTRSGSSSQATRQCTDTEALELEAALGVVRDYWALPYEGEYSLFSATMRQTLQEMLGVADAAQYAGAMASNQRIWLKQVYQQAELLDPAHARVTMLADWEQQGYRGVQTVVFDLEREGEVWRISVIFY